MCVCEREREREREREQEEQQTYIVWLKHTAQDTPKTQTVAEAL